MASSALQKLILAMPDAQHGTGVDAAQITAAARTLGTRFPADYSGFLARLGWAVIGPQEIFGPGSDLPLLWMDVAAVTAQERLDGGLPAELIAVHADRGGNFHCLDTSQVDAAGLAPVVFWAHDDQAHVRVVAPTFMAWLQDLIARHRS